MPQPAKAYPVRVYAQAESALASPAVNVWLSICPVPPSPELRKVALGAEEVVPFEHVSDVVSLVKRLQADGYKVIAVEQTVHSVKLDAFRREPSARYALVFGNEVDGVQQAVVDACDCALEIPQQGTKHSLNVSVSIGVTLWGIR